MEKNDSIFWLKQIKDKYIHGGDEEFDNLRREAIDEAIKALENSSWIPVFERLPEERLFNPSGSDFGFDFDEVLCTTIWGDVRAYKFGKPKGHDKPHFWLAGGIMDEYVIAWQYKPQPYKKEERK